MNPLLPPNAAVPQDRYAVALQINRDALDRELNATNNALRQTVQLQQEAQIGLQDRIALLGAQLADARRDQERMRAELEAARVASTAMARQNASQQAELTQMRPRDALLRQLVVRAHELNRMGVPDFNDRYQQLLQCVEPCEAEMYIQIDQKIWLKEHWEPIIAELIKAKPLYR